MPRNEVIGTRLRKKTIDRGEARFGLLRRSEARSRGGPRPRASRGTLLAPHRHSIRSHCRTASRGRSPPGRAGKAGGPLVARQETPGDAYRGSQFLSVARSWSVLTGVAR